MNKTRRVEVDWVDSISWYKIWDNITDVVENYEKNGMERMKTVGYMVANTKGYVILAQNLHFNDDNTVSRGGGFFILPKGCVSNIKQL